MAWQGSHCDFFKREGQRDSDRKVSRGGTGRWGLEKNADLKII